MAYLLNFSLLRRNHEFRLLFCGQFVSFIGTMITSVALPYQIYHETHSTLMVGLLSLCQLLPLLLTALWGGALADRYHRRGLLIISEICLIIGCGLLTLNAWLPTPSVAAIFILATLMSAFTGVHRPALDSLVQQCVAKKDFNAVGALATFKYSFCAIIGPAIGGVLIARLGLISTYSIDTGSFAFSLIMLLLMRAFPKPTFDADESTLSAIKEGFRYAFSRQELTGSYVVDFVAMIFGMPMALFPAIAHAHHSVELLGMLYAAPAIGSLIVSLFSGWTHRIVRHGLAIGWSAALWGVAIIGFGLSPLPFGLIFLVLAGAFDGISGIFRMTLWNSTIPTEYRGRLAGIEMISYLSGPKLGDTEAGLMAAAFGVSFSVISGGVLCVLGVIAACYMLPRFIQYRDTTSAS